jgi:predicted HTH transcriptional regulator
MYQTTQELLQAIRLGEDSSLELKAVVFSGVKIKGPGRDELAEELAAFANAKGGVLVLGVDDKTKDILGIPVQRLEEVETLIRDVANDSIDPPLYLTIHRIELPDAMGTPIPLIRIDIDRSLFVHAAKGKYQIRVGSSKRPMAADYLARLMQQRSQARLIRFDEHVVPGTSINTLSLKLIERYRSELSDPDLETFANKLAMVRPDAEGAIRATVAGVLFATENPRDFLPNAFIQAVAYRGTFATAFDDLRNYQSDAEDIEGPLDEQVIGACQFVFRNMTVAGTKDLGRSDLPQYDLTAVFEAMVNAVAHRDYSMPGSKIRLRMFADRLKLHIPGDLANSMDVDALPARQATRNEAIASLLAKTPVRLTLRGFETPRQFMMDRRGEGVNQILLRSERLSGRRPIYETVGDGELILTIFAAIPPTPSTTADGGSHV